MELNVNVLDYLSEEEITNMVREETREIIRRKLHDSTNFERIFSNSAYLAVYKEIDNSVDGEATKTITQKVKKILSEDLNWYQIFRKRDVWDKEESNANRILNEAIVANKDVIVEKVEKALKSVQPKTITGEIKEIMLELIKTRLTK